MKKILENEYAIIRETEQDYDFIAAIENKTEQKLKITFTGEAESYGAIEIEASYWCGLLATYGGRAMLEAIKNGDFIIEEV